MKKPIVSKRGAIPIEMLAMLVVGLVVLVVIVLFFKGGLGEIGKKFGVESGKIKGQTGTVTTEMSKGVTIGITLPPGGCTGASSLSCTTYGGICTTATECTDAGGLDPGDVHGCTFPKPVCCCHA